jgi:hypothetical protein
MRALKKAMIIIVILVAGILITWQAVNKNKVMLDIKPKDIYGVNAHNQVKLLSSKAVPDLIQRLEPLTKTMVVVSIFPKPKSAISIVFFSSSINAIFKGYLHHL